MKSIKEIIQKKSDTKLIDMVEKPSGYQEEFALEAFEELKQRKIEFNDVEIQKIIKRNERIKDKLKQEKKKQEFIVENKPHMFYVITMFILGAILFRIVKMSLFQYGVNIGFLKMPYLPDVLNIISLILILHFFIKGIFQLRVVFLIGFLINTTISIFIITNYMFSNWDISVYLTHILFKLIALLLFFSKPINQWIKLVNNRVES